MSQQAVNSVVHALVTDEHLRDRFARSPMEVLVDLQLWSNLELTIDEVEALVLADPDVWRSNEGGSPGRIH